MSNERKLATMIIAAMGGKENINTVAYCMTRLRVAAADYEKVDRAALKTIDGVLGLVEATGQFQIIVGPGVVNKVAAEVTAITGLQMGEVNDLKTAIADKNKTPFKLFLRKVASVFVPLIPAIVAFGMIAGITNIAIRAGAQPESTMVIILGTIGWGWFGYLFLLVLIRLKNLAARPLWVA